MVNHNTEAAFRYALFYYANYTKGADERSQDGDSNVERVEVSFHFEFVEL